ncbi:MAG: hypothetical protein JKY09_07355 [Crocinitomicaceae bacterium]|nr:hypothetical protein [Crocinitomicaceae bacterium]
MTVDPREKKGLNDENIVQSRLGWKMGLESNHINIEKFDLKIGEIELSKFLLLEELGRDN